MPNPGIARKPGETSKTLVRLPDLAAPARKVCIAAAIKQQQQQESWKRGTGRSSTTLAKYPDLRIVLVSMKANTRMREHKAAGRLTILALTGCLRLHILDHVVDLPAGHLLTLDRCLSHDVEALRQSTFLLTIAWPDGQKRP